MRKKMLDWGNGGIYTNRVWKFPIGSISRTKDNLEEGNMKRQLLSTAMLAAALAAGAQTTAPSTASFDDRQTNAPAIRLAVYGDKGAPGARNFPPLLKDASDIKVEILDGQQIRDGALDRFDLVLLPGGSGKGQGDSMGPEGVEKVKQFVASGKGFIGICAGAYFPIQQGFLNAKTKDPRWRRGKAFLKIEFSETALKLFGEQYKGLQEVKYANGPVMDANISTNLPPVEVLAWFRTETAANGTPEGIQVNSPAILLSTYGKGTMLVISPHPEQTPGLRGLMVDMIRFIAGKSKAK